jgi:hypothetical protein
MTEPEKCDLLIRPGLSRHNIERGLSLIFKGTMDINIVAQETDLSDAILNP